MFRGKHGRNARSRVLAELMAVALGLTAGKWTWGQCPSAWLPSDGVPGVVGSGTVFASTAWDPDRDGPQPALVVFGGTFLAAGDLAVSRIAAWDGARWHTLGDGLNAQVRALIVHNGELIAAAGHNGFGNPGPANGVARWDGTSWQPLGSAGFQNVVWALTAYEGEIYAGGIFNSAGGTPVNNIARWDGTTWHAVGAGIPGGATALTVFNGELLAASNGVLRWNGAAWETFAPGLTGSVKTFATYNGDLVVGGSFQTMPATPIDEVARWTGTAWLLLGGGMDNDVNTLLEFNGELIAGGQFTTVEGQPASRMARWNGANWLPIAAGPGMPNRRCDTLTLFNGDLYAGGATTAASGAQAEQVGRWSGLEWNYLGVGFDAIVYDTATYNGELIAGGWFSTAGDIEAVGIARRDNTGQWHSMGDVSGGDGFVFDLVVYDDVLIATGSFSAIGGVPTTNGTAQWDGEFWQQFGSDDVGIAKKLVHDGELYAPGGFGPNQKVARWDPLAHDWQPIGTFQTNAGVTCLTIFEGDLIAGGIGGIGVNASVWRWDFDAPGTWQPIGQHLGFNLLQTLGAFDGELLAGGYIEAGLVRFNGTSWVPVGGGLFLSNESPDEILAVFDLRIFNGDLIVAGTFSYAGAQQYTPETVAAFHVASWNGANWQALGSGTNNAVVSLHEHERDLMIGGWFDLAGGGPAGHLARWGPAVGDLDQSSHVNLADWDLFVDCLAGPGAAPPPGCDCADADTDGDVDLGDAAAFQIRLMGV